MKGVMKGRYDDVEVTNNYNPPPSKVVRAVGLVVKSKAIETLSNIAEKVKTAREKTHQDSQAMVHSSLSTSRSRVPSVPPGYDRSYEFTIPPGGPPYGMNFHFSLIYNVSFVSRSSCDVKVGSIIVRVGDEMDGFVLDKRPGELVRKISVAPSGPEIKLKLFFLKKGYESNFEYDTPLPKVEDIIVKKSEEYLAILNLTNPPEEYEPLEVSKTFFEKPYKLCNVSRHGRIYHACTENTVESVWKEIGWGLGKLDVLIKSMALSGERQKEVITVKIKDICEQEIRGNWSKFLLSDKRKDGAGGGWRVLKISSNPSIEVESVTPTPAVVGFVYEHEDGWKGRAFVEDTDLPSHLPDYALPSLKTGVDTGEFSYHLPVGRGTQVQSGFTKWSQKEGGTFVAITVVGGDGNSLSVYDTWETLVPSMINEACSNKPSKLPPPPSPMTPDPLTSLVEVIGAVPIRVLSSLLIATLHERPTFVFSYSRSLLFHVFTTVSYLLRPLIYRHVKLSFCRSDIVEAMVDSPIPFMLGTDDRTILKCKDTVVIDLTGTCGVMGRSYEKDDEMSFALSRRNWVELTNTFHTKEERKNPMNQAKVFKMVVGEFVKLQIGNRGARRWRTDEGWGVDDEGLGEVKNTQSWICYYSA